MSAYVVDREHVVALVQSAMDRKFNPYGGDSCMKTQKRIHGQPIPLHEKHGLSATPPVPCDFKLGDSVIFTNDAGGRFERTVWGFSNEPQTKGYTGFIYIFPETSSWWFPVKPENLKLA